MKAQRKLINRLDQLTGSEKKIMRKYVLAAERMFFAETRRKRKS